MPFQLSPGVQVIEKDFSTIVPAVSSSTGAFAGPFAWGPVEDPIRISSENELVSRFGKPTDSNYESFFTASNFLAYTNSMFLCRANTTGIRNAVSEVSSGVASVALKSAGSGYTTSDTITVTFSNPELPGGTRAIAEVVTTTGTGNAVTITGLTITNSGSGYTTAPTILISSPQAGSRAVAVAFLRANNTVSGLKLKNVTQYVNQFSENETAGSYLYGEFAAKFPGSMGNGLKVVMADSGNWALMGDEFRNLFTRSPSTSSFANKKGIADDELHVAVYDNDQGTFSGIPNSLLEKYAFLSKLKDAKSAEGNAIYWKSVISAQSKYVWVLGKPLPHNLSLASTTSFSNKSLIASDTDITLTSADGTLLDGQVYIDNGAKRLNGINTRFLGLVPGSAYALSSSAAFTVSSTTVGTQVNTFYTFTVNKAPAITSYKVGDQVKVYDPTDSAKFVIGTVDSFTVVNQTNQLKLRITRQVGKISTSGVKWTFEYIPTAAEKGQLTVNDFVTIENVRYIVESVQSDTVATLKTPYIGSTVTPLEPVEIRANDVSDFIDIVIDTNNPSLVNNITSFRSYFDLSTRRQETVLIFVSGTALLDGYYRVENVELITTVGAQQKCRITLQDELKQTERAITIAGDAGTSETTGKQVQIFCRNKFSWNLSSENVLNDIEDAQFPLKFKSLQLLNGTYSVILSGGQDNFNATEGDIRTAYDFFKNTESYDISLVATGRTSPDLANYIIQNLAEVRKDCVVFVSPNDYLNGGGKIDGFGDDATGKMIDFRNALTSSNYAVMDSGYKYQYDRFNDVYRWVPLNGDVAGLCARTDFTADPWFSPGGYTRGQIKNVVKLAFNPTQTDRDVLYVNSINPVVTFPGQGTVLFGDKTLQSKPSAFDRINVRRLFIVLEKSIATAAKFQLFEFNDSFTRAQFRNLVEPFLRDVQGRRGIIDFRVKCDESNNTGEVIDRNEFVADIFIKPNRSINFITLNFVASRSSISFDEIGA